MATQIMGWNKTQKRWFKRYRGTLYFVSPKQLDCPPTKEASREAANRWWQAKQHDIDEALGKAKQHPVEIVKHYQECIEDWRLYAKWNRTHGFQHDLPEAERADKMIDYLTKCRRSSSSSPARPCSNADARAA
jgi:hypothetical protein